MGNAGETTHLRNPKDPLPFGVFALFTPDEAMPKDKPPRLKRRGLTILVCAGIMGMLWGLAQSPEFVEDVYARNIGYLFARGLGFVSGFVPTSLAEICVIGAGLYLFIPFCIAAVHVIQRKRRILNAVAAGFFRFWAFAALILALFYLSWGVNYAREPLPKRLGWKAIETPADEAENAAQTEEIAALAEQLVIATNANYREFAGDDDFGRTSFPPANAMALEAALNGAYERVQKKLSLEQEFAVARAPAKPVAASILMNYMGLGGFYFPWTGEANYNRLLPAPMLPHTIAHEKAHQRGITSEDECNFLGYLVCISSDDAYVRYSGYLFAQRQLLGELYARDRGAAKKLVAMRVPGVQRDIDAIRTFWQQFEGAAEQVSQAVNDTYLKSQGVKGGVASYAASQSLIILFARSNGGSAVVALPKVKSE
jgi:hypothetical protein